MQEKHDWVVEKSGMVGPEGCGGRRRWGADVRSGRWTHDVPSELTDRGRMMYEV